MTCRRSPTAPWQNDNSRKPTTPAQPIPPPHVLDPDRLLRNDRGDMTEDDHRTRSSLLEAALHETCADARHLWDHLDALRHFLIDSLPPDSRSPGPHRTASVTPTGPDDEQGWENWIAAYASVNSVLADHRANPAKA